MSASIKQRNVRIPDQLWEAAQAEAARREETITVVVRRSLEHYVGACDCCGRIPGD